MPARHVCAAGCGPTRSPQADLSIRRTQHHAYRLCHATQIRTSHRRCESAECVRALEHINSSDPVCNTVTRSNYEKTYCIFGSSCNSTGKSDVPRAARGRSRDFFSIMFLILRRDRVRGAGCCGVRVRVEAPDPCSHERGRYYERNLSPTGCWRIDIGKLAHQVLSRLKGVVGEDGVCPHPLVSSRRYCARPQNVHALADSSGPKSKYRSMVTTAVAGGRKVPNRPPQCRPFAKECLSRQGIQSRGDHRPIALQEIAREIYDLRPDSVTPLQER